MSLTSTEALMNIVAHDPDDLALLDQLIAQMLGRSRRFVQQWC